MSTKNPLQAIREMNCYSQHYLAEQAGISQATVSRIENGKHKPHMDTTKLIAKALNVSHAWLHREILQWLSEQKLIVGQRRSSLK